MEATRAAGSSPQTGQARLALGLASRATISALLVGGMLLLLAGSWGYWEAGWYCGVLLTARLATGLHFLRRKPALLRRRLKLRERERQQWVSRSATGVCVLLGRVLAGLDYRYGWSQAPAAVVVMAGVGMLGVFALQFRVFRENEFAATTIEVEEGQRVISSGPYAFVRHPMYLSALLLFAFSPLALGSYWAALAFLPAPVGLVLRLRNEEAVLLRDLPGYGEYCRRVRWRLFPGVW